MKHYRDNGAIGALLDEYEKSMDELKAVVAPLTSEQLVQIVDRETNDEDCRSIQTILTHVVRAGYTYVIAIRKHMGETINYKDRVFYTEISDYLPALDKVMQANVELFDDYPDITLEETDVSKKMKMRWGPIYDVEQLMEHAIVHILRHRRQIERFLLKM